MRVGIDVSILSERAGGVWAYVFSLVQALRRLDSETEWVLLGVGTSMEGLPSGRNIQAVQVPGLTGTRRILWEQTGLPALAARAEVDLLHCPDFSRPLVCTVPIVNTIHDLSFFQTQALFPATKRLYKRVVCSVALRRSRGIIAVSNFTRNEILRRFPIDQGKVVVIHNGFCAPPCGQRQGGSPYVLFVGTLEKRKDVATLVRAFGLLRRSRRIPHRLILVGQRGFGWGEIQAAIRSTSCPQDIDCLGHTKREEVERLFRGADLFVYPSTYEGFGLPILEAMACGTPVACSRAASLPEVAGDAAEYFEPASVDGLAEAMERVLGSAARQDELRRKGLERVKLFSWDECARRHLAVYRELAGNGKSRATSTGQAGTFAKD